MRESFRGWYKPTDDEVTALWEKGTIVLDANVLLAPYRISEQARKRLFDLVEAYREQVWVPYQAGFEYQRNRLAVVAAQRATYADIREKLDIARKALLNRRPDHPVLNLSDFESVVTRALDSIARYVDRVEDQHPDVLGEDRDDDVVRNRWDELLAGCMGVRLVVDEDFEREADKRYAASVPPGFADSKRDKGSRIYGDLILWRELLTYVESKVAEASGDALPVIFVTDDAKEDWWRQSEGKNLGPRPELVEEMAAVGGTPFWVYTVARFMSVGAMRLHWEDKIDLTREVEVASELDRFEEEHAGADTERRGESGDEPELTASGDKQEASTGDAGVESVTNG